MQKHTNNYYKIGSQGLRLSQDSIPQQVHKQTDVQTSTSHLIGKDNIGSSCVSDTQNDDLRPLSPPSDIQISLRNHETAKTRLINYKSFQSNALLKKSKINLDSIINASTVQRKQQKNDRDSQNGLSSLTYISQSSAVSKNVITQTSVAEKKQGVSTLDQIVNEFIPQEQKGGETIENSTQQETSRQNRIDLHKINENKMDFLPNKLIPFQIKFGHEKHRSMVEMAQTNRPNDLKDNLSAINHDIKKLRLNGRFGQATDRNTGRNWNNLTTFRNSMSNTKTKRHTGAHFNSTTRSGAPEKHFREVKTTMQLHTSEGSPSVFTANSQYKDTNTDLLTHIDKFNTVTKQYEKAVSENKVKFKPKLQNQNPFFSNRNNGDLQKKKLLQEIDAFKILSQEPLIKTFNEIKSQKLSRPKFPIRENFSKTQLDGMKKHVNKRPQFRTQYPVHDEYSIQPAHMLKTNQILNIEVHASMSSQGRSTKGNVSLDVFSNQNPFSGANSRNENKRLGNTGDSNQSICINSRNQIFGRQESGERVNEYKTIQYLEASDIVPQNFKFKQAAQQSKDKTSLMEYYHSIRRQINSQQSHYGRSPKHFGSTQIPVVSAKDQASSQTRNSIDGTIPQKSGTTEISTILHNKQKPTHQIEEDPLSKQKMSSVKQKTFVRSLLRKSQEDPKKIDLQVGLILTRFGIKDSLLKKEPVQKNVEVRRSIQYSINVVDENTASASMSKPETIRKSNEFEYVNRSDQNAVVMDSVPQSPKNIFDNSLKFERPNTQQAHVRPLNRIKIKIQEQSLDQSLVQTDEFPQPNVNTSKGNSIKFMDHSELMKQYRGQEPVPSISAKRKRNSTNISQDSVYGGPKKKFQNEVVKRVFFKADQLLGAKNFQVSQLDDNLQNLSSDQNPNDVQYMQSDVAQGSVKGNKTIFNTKITDHAYSINRVQSMINDHLNTQNTKSNAMLSVDSISNAEEKFLTYEQMVAAPMNALKGIRQSRRVSQRIDMNQIEKLIMDNKITQNQCMLINEAQASIDEPDMKQMKLRRKSNSPRKQKPHSRAKASPDLRTQSPKLKKPKVQKKPQMQNIKVQKVQAQTNPEPSYNASNFKQQHLQMQMKIHQDLSPQRQNELKAQVDQEEAELNILLIQNQMSATTLRKNKEVEEIEQELLQSDARKRLSLDRVLLQTQRNFQKLECAGFTIRKMSANIRHHVVTFQDPIMIPHIGLIPSKFVDLRLNSEIPNKTEVFGDTQKTLDNDHRLWPIFFRIKECPISKFVHFQINQVFDSSNRFNGLPADLTVFVSNQSQSPTLENCMKVFEFNDWKSSKPAELKFSFQNTTSSIYETSSQLPIFLSVQSSSGCLVSVQAQTLEGIKARELFLANQKKEMRSQRVADKKLKKKNGEEDGCSSEESDCDHQPVFVKNKGPTDYELRLINDQLDDYLEKNSHMIEVVEGNKVQDYVDLFLQKNNQNHFSKAQVLQRIKERADYKKYSIEYSKIKQESLEVKNRNMRLDCMNRWNAFRQDLLSSKEHLVKLYKQRFVVERLIAIAALAVANKQFKVIHAVVTAKAKYRKALLVAGKKTARLLKYRLRAIGSDTVERLRRSQILVKIPFVTQCLYSNAEHKSRHMVFLALLAVHSRNLLLVQIKKMNKNVEVIQKIWKRKILDRPFYLKYIRSLFEKERKFLPEFFAKKTTPLAKKVKSKYSNISQETILEMTHIYSQLKGFQNLEFLCKRQIKFLSTRCHFLQFVKEHQEFIQDRPLRKPTVQPVSLEKKQVSIRQRKREYENQIQKDLKAIDQFRESLANTQTTIEQIEDHIYGGNIDTMNLATSAYMKKVQRELTKKYKKKKVLIDFVQMFKFHLEEQEEFQYLKQPKVSVEDFSDFEEECPVAEPTQDSNEFGAISQTHLAVKGPVTPKGRSLSISKRSQGTSSNTNLYNFAPQWSDKQREKLQITFENFGRADIIQFWQYVIGHREPFNARPKRSEIQRLFIKACTYKMDEPNL